MSKKSIERHCLQLGYPGNIDGALKHAVAMHLALRVILTWTCVPGALDSGHLSNLCRTVLHLGPDMDPDGAQQ